MRKLSDGLFLECFQNTAATKGGGVLADDVVVDNVCLQLAADASNFDVLVMGNMYGDVVNDICASITPPSSPLKPLAVAGGVNFCASGSFGGDFAVFETVMSLRGLRRVYNTETLSISIDVDPAYGPDVDAGLDVDVDVDPAYGPDVDAGLDVDVDVDPAYGPDVDVDSCTAHIPNLLAATWATLRASFCRQYFF